MNDRQRLEAIISVVCKYLPPDGISIEKAMNEIIGLIDPLPAQQEQEPIKDWVASHNAICALLRQAHDALALTSYPMKRTWVGLTDDEMEETFIDELDAICQAKLQRTWVGLTDEEMEETFIECGGMWNGGFWTIEAADFHPFLITIEAKLKEKNT